ncbi:alpha/beta hydrolase [Rasiella sp. SM2506]|uniref:alpha/beta hydrolase n=1 Tax=Rasiella sp. SM2506 TaxID=3423914 RepID=UPI003D7A1275
MKEKQVTYTTSNTYTTLNSYTSKTKNVWLVFHGMGYLSTYFGKYFKELDSEENFVIIPQAPSKFYLGKEYRHVGANWLTKVNTVEDTKNVLSYIDAVWKEEKPKTLPRFIILGYSQGVSIAMRWLASRKILCDAIVLHSGGIPKELNKNDFQYLSESCKVTYLYGDKDPYITEAKKTEEILKGNSIFGDRLDITVFKGVHEVYIPFINRLAEKKVR